METWKFLLSTSFYPPYHVGGDAIHVKYLAEELVKRGHEVHVLHSLDAYRVKRKSFPEKAEPDLVHTHTIKTHLNLSSYVAYVLGNSSLISKRFDGLVNEIKPDVVHHHNISLLGYGLLKKRRRYLNLFTAHDYWLVCQQNNQLRNGSEICEEGSCFFCALKCGRPPQIWRSFKSFKTAIESIDLVIFPSNYVRRKLAREINVKSVTLPNFVPSPPKDISPIGYSDYFLFVGMLEIHKGILNLLELFKKHTGEINARLVIVGDGSLKNHIMDFIKRNSLSSFVSYAGFVDDKKLYSLYKNALALIIPSIWPENAPLVALEALSVGTPVIASNNGGLPEIIEKVDRKLIFDNLDRLEDILTNFSRKEFSSQKIKHIYEQNFSPEAYIDKYIETIRSI
jgi:glycosyltransferase involved in cell wall biosynthesis